MEYITANAIKELREKKGLTQRQLAEQIGVSDKAVSKWETGRGLPDVSLLVDLSAALGISVAELLTGQYAENQNRSANMKRTNFYLCPICGNLIQATGKGAFTCCGVNLPPLEPETPDEGHAIQMTDSDGDLFVTLAHPMEKTHFITFLACVTSDRVDFLKLYPEGAAQGRFPRRGHGFLLACCNRHGLFARRF